MRKIKIIEHVSLDGVIQAPGGPEEDPSDGFNYGGWTAPLNDREGGAAIVAAHEYWTHILREADLLVYGRKTYQLMVPFWPDVAKSQSMTKALNEFALAFDSLDKVVFSRSLDHVDDGNTRIVHEPVR